MNLAITHLALKRLDDMRRRGEQRGQALSRLINATYNRSAQSRPQFASAIDAARERYFEMTGHWPEES